MLEVSFLGVLHSMVEAVFDDAIVVALCLFRDPFDHALAHLEEAVKFEALAFSNIWVVIGGLDHEKQVEVLIAFSIVLQLVKSYKSLGDIINDSLHHLSFLRQTETVQHNSHHIIDLVILKDKR